MWWLSSVNANICMDEYIPSFNELINQIEIIRNNIVNEGVSYQDWCILLEQLLPEFEKSDNNHQGVLTHIQEIFEGLQKTLSFSELQKK